MLPLLIPSPEIQYFEIGPLRIYVYALTMILAITVAAIITGRRLSKRGGEAGAVIDFVIWAVVFGFIGARTYHVLTHLGDYVGPGKNLLDVFAIWQGGIAVFGALLGGAIGVFIASRLTGIRFWSLADALVPGMLVAQAIGRIGNYFNQELFGGPTTLPWGLQIDPGNAAAPIGLPADTLYHPTFLYEIIWNLLGVVLLLAIEKRFQPRWGKFFALYLIWYGIGRFWIEGLRLDPSFSLLGLRTNQLTAVLAVILGIVLFFVLRRVHPGRELSVYIPGRNRPGKSTLAATADESKYHHVLQHETTNP